MFPDESKEQTRARKSTRVGSTYRGDSVSGKAQGKTLGSPKNAEKQRHSERSTHKHRGQFVRSVGLSPTKFQTLFHPLIRVFFNFRSSYLFAIGLPYIFSFGSMCPPAFTQVCQPVLLVCHVPCDHIPMPEANKCRRHRAEFKRNASV